MGKYRAPVQAYSGLYCTVSYCTEKNSGETGTQGEGAGDESSKDRSHVFSWQSTAELFAFLAPVLNARFLFSNRLLYAFYVILHPSVASSTVHFDACINVAQCSTSVACDKPLELS